MIIFNEFGFLNYYLSFIILQINGQNSLIQNILNELKDNKDTLLYENHTTEDRSMKLSSEIPQSSESSYSISARSKKAKTTLTKSKKSHANTQKTESNI